MWHTTEVILLCKYGYSCHFIPLSFLWHIINVFLISKRLCLHLHFNMISYSCAFEVQKCHRDISISKWPHLYVFVTWACYLGIVLRPNEKLALWTTNDCSSVWYLQWTSRAVHHDRRRTDRPVSVSKTDRPRCIGMLVLARRL